MSELKPGIKNFGDSKKKTFILMYQIRGLDNNVMWKAIPMAANSVVRLIDGERWSVGDHKYIIPQLAGRTKENACL